MNGSTALPKDRALIHLQRNPPHLGPRPVIADRHGGDDGEPGGLHCPGQRLIEAWTDAVSVKWRGQGQ